LYGQQPTKTPVLGFLVAGTQASHGAWVTTFTKRLSELGWTEGRNIKIQYRWAAGNARQMAEFATAKIPTLFGFREFVDAGGLISYGPNFTDLFKRAAEFADKILRGAKPADIPVEQPVKFDLVINLKTASVLGLNIPYTLLASADEVIE